MNRVLVDTSIWISFFKGDENTLIIAQNAIQNIKSDALSAIFLT